MKHRTRYLICTSVLLGMIGAIFFGGKPGPSSAQDAPLSQQKAPFKTYLLGVYCRSPQFPTASFTYHVREERAMGSTEICAGKCGGGIVSLADALAQLPAEVRGAFRALVAQHEADAAAGKGKPPLPCLKGGEKSPPEKKCEKPTPWFGGSANCRDLQSPTYEVNTFSSMVELTMCGLYVFRHIVPRDRYDMGVYGYKQRLERFVTERVGSKICCDKLRDAVRTGIPCNPSEDIDCDGKSNYEDFFETAAPFPTILPDINNLLSEPEGASIDPFPKGLNADDTEFFPPQDKCDCKWELKKGTLNCSRDGRRPHYYQAWWRCPSTGNERFTRKEAPATAPCTQPNRRG